MRVKESSPAYNMGKSKNKKHRIRKTKDAEIASDSSDDGQGTLSGCPHINKAVNFAAMRKAVLKAPYGQCVGCSREGGAAAAAPAEAVGGAEGGEGDADSETTVWVCLQCGNQGCDRNSKEKHALKHFETPHSGAHCIVLNLSTWLVWCYSCDDFIPLANSRRIQECGEFLRNKAGLPKLDLSQPSTPGGGARRPPTPGKAEAGAGEHQQAAVRENRTANHKAPACQKVKGLNNLGNTCFFNAVMQNLSQTPGLEAMLLERTRKNICGTLPGKTAALEHPDAEEDSAEDLPPLEISLGEPGPLTSSLLAFMQEMNNASSRGATVNPDSLFKLICKKAPRFKGFQQQDSHELLRYLLDVIKSEEVKRGQSGILKHFKVPENVNPKKVDEDVKLKVKEYGKQVKQTFLDSLMGGYLVSTVMCEECKHISQVFEGFLDLSLPVTDEKPFRLNQGRRREAGEGEEGGDPVVAHLPARPSKHSDKRNRRAAKKAAKRRGRAGDHHDAGLGQSVDPSKGDGQQAEEGLPEEEEEEEEEAEVEGGNADASRKEEADGNESNSSQREDPSVSSSPDADVEDNLESENSRQGGSDLHRDAQPGSCPPVPAVFQTSEDGGSVADSGIAASPELDSSNSCSLVSHARKDRATDAAVMTNGTGHFEDGKTALEDSGVSSGQNGVCGLAVTDQCQSLAEQMEELNLADSRTNGAEAGTSMSVDFTVTLPANGFQEVNGDASVPMEKEEQAGDSREAGAVEHAAGAEDANNCSSQATAGQPQPSSPATGEAAATARPGSSRRGELRREAQVRSLTTLAPRHQPSNTQCSVSSCLNQFTAAELLTGPNRVICPECTRLQQHKEGGEKVYSNASKQYLLFSLPPVLTLHLKRFENVGLAARKVNRYVEFPLLLDMAPYCSALCQGARPGQTRVLYSLYGTVEHSGKLNSGHYKAHVKVRPNVDLIQSFLQPGPQQPEDYVQRYVEQVLHGQTPGAALEQTPSEDTLASLVPPGRWYEVSDCRVSEVQEAQVLRTQAYLLFYERIY